MLVIPLPSFEEDYSKVLYDRQGELLSATVAGDEQWRFPPADSVPEKFQHCILQFEDRYFHYHPGINPVSIIRAIYLNIKHKRIISGGSTLSMQVVRLRAGNRTRTILQKLKEMVMTLQLELKQSKAGILRLYAAHAPFGGNTVGLEAASRRYYQRSPFDLTWAESATLAVLPNAPSLVHPGKNPVLLEQKRNKLLRRLLEKEIIDSLTYQTSVLEPVPEVPQAMPQLADHFLHYAVQQEQSPIVHSTLDLHLQKSVNKLVNKHYNQLKNNDIHNIGVVIIDVRTRELVAYTGNTNCGAVHHNFVDVVQAPRSTGSILKPLLYCAMLNEGVLLPHQLVADIPTRYGNYAPKNFSQTHAGAVPADVALARSLNVPAVRLLHAYGLDKFHFKLRQLGFTTFKHPPDHYGLSLILGGGEARLWELAGIYTALAYQLNTFNDTHQYPIIQDNIIRYTVAQPMAITGQLQDKPAHFHTSSIYLTFRAMQEVSRPATESGWEHFASSRPVSWKTGTSFGFKDAWSIGLHAGYCVGIWVGNADGEGRPMLTGNTAAAPLMFEIFGLLEHSAGFKIPYDNLKQMEICAQSGFLKGLHCDDSHHEWLPDVEIKTGPCPYHTLVHISRHTGRQVNRHCAVAADILTTPWFVLPPAQEWYYKKHHNAYQTLPAWDPGCEAENPIDQLQIIYPETNMRIYIPKERSGQSSALVCKAVHRKEPVQLFWYLNDEFLGTTRYVHEMELKHISGSHKLSVTDAFGERQEVQFSIVSGKQNQVY